MERSHTLATTRDVPSPMDVAKLFGVSLPLEMRADIVKFADDLKSNEKMRAYFVSASYDVLALWNQQIFHENYLYIEHNLQIYLLEMPCGC
jgi:hypothetical protein